MKILYGDETEASLTMFLTIVCRRLENMELRPVYRKGGSTSLLNILTWKYVLETSFHLQRPHGDMARLSRLPVWQRQMTSWNDKLVLAWNINTLQACSFCLLRAHQQLQKDRLYVSVLQNIEDQCMYAE